jgi:hypothetical protein
MPIAYHMSTGALLFDGELHLGQNWGNIGNVVSSQTNGLKLGKKRFLALTCEALARSVYAAAAASPHAVTIQLFRQGLHNTPLRLRDALQAQIDAIGEGDYDAILLAYGMCGLATVGLRSRHAPLVIPRTHDCIALYLGSLRRYQAEFEAHPGTYWYSLDFMERSDPGSAVALGVIGMDEISTVYEEYVEKYGQDNADYLMEVMGEWGKHYDRAVYIDMGLGDGSGYEQRAQAEAERRGWKYERREGDRRMVNMLVTGEWPDEEFLIVNPEHTIRQAADVDELVRAEKLEETDE